VVVKLGGKALSDGELVKELARKIVFESKRKQIAVVVSAMGRTTDTLIEHASKACEGKTSKQDLDEILSMGERTSARLFAATLRARGVKARFFDPSHPDWPIITDDQFGNANPLLDECTSRIKNTVMPLLEKGAVPIIPGFVGKTLRGEITTLGRGGSDTTAFLLAKATEAEEVVLVTDVDGVMTADPKIVPNSRKIEKIDVEKLVNLCDSGVKFLHRKALRYLDGSFKVRIVNHRCKELNDGGTVVEGKFPKNRVSAEHSSPTAMITIIGKNLANDPKTLPRLMRKINRNKIQVFAWLANLDSVCLYVPEEKVGEVVEAIRSHTPRNDEGLAVAVRKNLAFIKIFGVGVENIPRVFKQVSESLERNGINFFWVSTIASNTLVFVEWKDKDAALSVAKKVLKSVEG